MDINSLSDNELREYYESLSKEIERIEYDYQSIPNLYTVRAKVKHQLASRGIIDNGFGPTNGG